MSDRSVQVELRRLPDLTLRQVIDATRVFKEQVRVDRALAALGGSMFWKTVGDYEYLVQRNGKRLTYLGPRAASTQARYDAFLGEREELKQRSTLLHQSVEVAQRMNRAVRAGIAPTPLIEILNQIERLGLGTRCLLLGAGALLVYAQVAGVTGCTLPTSTLMHIALDAAESGMWASRLRTVLERRTQVDVADLGDDDGLLLRVRFDASPLLAGGRKRRSAPIDSPGIADALRVIGDAPTLEHVVIGTTGKMAFVRTIDPGMFALLARRQASDALPVIDQMLDQRMVKSLLDTHRYEQLEQQLEGIERGSGLAIA